MIMQLRLFLEFFTYIPELELAILGIQNVREMISIATSYLWLERRKLARKEKTQYAHQISLGIRAICWERGGECVYVLS